MPWQYTTVMDLVDRWHSLLAGLIASIAAIITVVVTLKVERRKVDREIDALHKSLAIELRPREWRSCNRVLRYIGWLRHRAMAQT